MADSMRPVSSVGLTLFGCLLFGLLLCLCMHGQRHEIFSEIMQSDDFGRSSKALRRVVMENTNSSTLLCRVIIETVFRSSSVGMLADDRTMCTPIINAMESHNSYALSIPNHIAQRHESKLRQGNLYVTIPGARLNEDSVWSYRPSDMDVVDDVVNHPERTLELVPGTGIRSILVLRVSVIDSEPGFTAGEFRDRIFGSKNVTVHSQYKKCSAGKLKFVPAHVGEHGVLEVNIQNRSISDFSSITALSNAAQDTAAEILGLPPDEPVCSLADHVMICLPPGTGAWIGAAVMNHWRSVYNDKFCGILSSSVHELG